jgi:very-short-patch-repair endonuclease
MANERARALRKSMTRGEIKLWLRLRELRAQGFHIRRQAPRDGYILDFVCIKHGLIIEIDGDHHGTPEGMARDARRDRHFAAQGLRTLRFSPFELDTNLDGVVETIYAALSAVPAAYPTRPRPIGEATLPASGEG